MSARIPALFQTIQKQIASLTGGQQKPVLFGNLDRAACVSRAEIHERPLFAKLPFDLALGFGPAPLLAPMQAAQTAAFGESWLPPFATEGVELQPESAVQQFRLLSSVRHTAEQLVVWRNRLGAKLADQGQDVVTRYGAGDQFPDSPDKLQRRDFEFAERCFRAALELFTDEGRHWDAIRQMLKARQEFCRGRALAFDQRRLVEARDVLLKARELEQPPIPEIDNALGISYLEYRTGVSDLDEAIRYFRRAKERSPGWAYPRHNLALAYIESGKHRAAEQEYREAIKAMPDYPYLYYNMGLLLHRANRPAEARRYYEKALEVSGKQTEAHLNLEKQWSSQQLKPEAELAAARAASFIRNTAEVHNSLGSLLAESRPDTAEVSFNEALALNAELYPARHNLALMLKDQTGRDVEAIKLLEDNVRRAPGFHPSQIELGKLYASQNRYKEAEASFRKALDVVEKAGEDETRVVNVDVRVRLNTVLAANGKLNDAESLLTDAINHLSVESKAPKSGALHGSRALAELYDALADLYATSHDSRECTVRLKAVQAGGHAAGRATLDRLKQRARHCM